MHCRNSLREDHQERHRATQNSQHRNKPDAARHIICLSRATPGLRVSRIEIATSAVAIVNNIATTITAYNAMFRLHRTRLPHQNKVRLHFGSNDDRRRNDQHPQRFRSCCPFFVNHRDLIQVGV